MSFFLCRHRVLVMDTDEDSVRAARDHTEYAYVVKGYDKKTLAETGIQNCDVVAVCLSDHMDTSILTVLNLVSLGVPKVIAEAAECRTRRNLRKAGCRGSLSQTGLCGCTVWRTVWKPLKYWTMSN